MNKFSLIDSAKGTPIVIMLREDYRDTFPSSKRKVSKVTCKVFRS